MSACGSVGTCCPSIEINVNAVKELDEMLK